MNISDAMLWRLGVFTWMLVVLMLLEIRFVGPNPSPRRRRRWPAHAALTVLDALVARGLAPAGAVGVALWAQSQHIGLLQHVVWPSWAQIALTVLIFDVAIYWQHRWMHSIAWLWPLHRTHHTDTTLDATSALRFHPVEILLSLTYKSALVLALGADPWAVLIFEALLSSFALITHANLRVPRRIDSALRQLLVTPAMHRIHHSRLVDEQRRNFGFHLSVWDRLFGSYAVDSQQTLQHEPQTFGVDGVEDAQTISFFALLREPFRRRA